MKKGNYKKNFKGNWKQMSKAKKLLLTTMVFMLCSGLVTASWLILNNYGFTANVVGGSSGYTESSLFSDLYIETNNSASSDTAEMIIDFDRVTPINVTYLVNKTDLTAGACDNYDTDCSVVISNNSGHEFPSGMVLDLEGAQTINGTVSCLRHSCEQEISVDVTLTEV